MKAKMHRQQGNILLAACDKEVLGKTFKQGKVSIKVDEKFYNGKEVSVSELGEMIAESTMGNLVGKKVISFAMKKGVVKKDKVLSIGKTEHAQYVKVKWLHGKKRGTD